MMKLAAAIKKEFLLLLSDKIGLFFMFALPLVLVVVITLVQSTAFDLVNENRITLLIVNTDEGELGDELVKMLMKSNMFTVETDSSVAIKNLKSELLERGKYSALYIPKDFSMALNNKTLNVVGEMLVEFGISDSAMDYEESSSKSLQFIYDPVLQKNFSSSILSVFYSYLNILENKMLIENLYNEMGYDEIPANLSANILANKVSIESHTASEDEIGLPPNITQHNVPAWTIFAMFFMVVSLGANIVNERVSGSFMRLKTMPTSISVVLGSKMIVFLLVAIIQVLLIFSMGITLFPKLGLPALVLPNHLFPLLVITLVSALAAVSYAFLVGTFAKTQVQANGFGAISIILFAALGGIWVPAFVMPENLQLISQFSPLKWCLDGFYVLFLQGGSTSQLLPIILPLFIFIMSSQIVSFIKLRVDKII